jgi:hypothetical protein
LTGIRNEILGRCHHIIAAETLNRKMPVAPILISLNNDIQFFPATPNKESGWEYRALQFEMTFEDSPKETHWDKKFKPRLTRVLKPIRKEPIKGRVDPNWPEEWWLNNKDK